jgi:hypothetical protein
MSLKLCVGDGNFDGYGAEYNHDRTRFQMGWHEGGSSHSAPTKSRYYRGGRCGEEEVTSANLPGQAPKSLRPHFCLCFSKLLSGGHDFSCLRSNASYDRFSGDDGSSGSWSCSIVVRLSNGSEETFWLNLDYSTDV